MFQFYLKIPDIDGSYWTLPLLQFLPLFLSGIIFYKIRIKVNKEYLNLILLLFCLIAQILLYSHAGRSHYYISKLEYGVILIIFFCFFYLIAKDKLKWIVNPLTLFLGKISYTLYLFHQFIILNVIIPYFVGELGFDFWLTIIFIASPLVILLAYYMNRYIEIPGTNYMKQYLKNI